MIEENGENSVLMYKKMFKLLWVTGCFRQSCKLFFIHHVEHTPVGSRIPLCKSSEITIEEGMIHVGNDNYCKTMFSRGTEHE